MAAHKRGRRNIRRLTRRKIALPAVTAQRSAETEANAELDFASAAQAVDEPVAEATPAAPSTEGAAAESGGVASSLAELRIPEDSVAAAAADEKLADLGGSPKTDSRAASAEVESAEKTSDAAAESSDAKPEASEDEPTTNPHIRLTESLALPQSDVAFDASWGSDRLDAMKRSNLPPPAAGVSSVPPPVPHATSASKPPADTVAESDAVDAHSAGAATESPAIASAAEATDGDADAEPETGQHRKLSAPPRKPDSDAPTRPRIELSTEMALAAGRVTSLELSPIRSEQPPRRGSKVPPPGEPRVVSSLTGRRSQFPSSSEAEDAAARPSVIVTRSKIISDRPPKPGESGPPAKREQAQNEGVSSGAIPRRVATEPDPREFLDIAKTQEVERTKLAVAESAGDVEEIAAAPEISEPETAEIAKPTQELARPLSLRPSRRPGALDGEEFETLDIEDGEVETQSMRADAEIDADFDDETPAKAPPPPPHLKRAGIPPAPAVPGAPKAAPPPPPRVSAPQGSAAAATVATSMPAPTPPNAVAAVASGGGSGVANLSTGGAAAPPAKRGNRPQARRRQWWETLFSDEYLRTVVRPTAAQIARQVDFMQASLGVTKGTAVLDVGCGLGQHALEFARRGCLVVALDLALPMITRAAEDAQQEGLRINFLHKDIRDIGFEGTFDAVVCVGTTFGFFDDEQNREVLGRLANALKPGGRLLLEVVNRDHVLGSQPNLQWFEGDGCVVMEESDFNYYSSRLTVKRTMMREDGRQTESEYSIRLYALHELGQMMQSVGFRVKEVSGGQATRGVFFGAQSSRIILLAERRTPNPTRGNGHSTSDAPVPAES